MAGIDRGDLYSGFKKGQSPSLPALQPTWQSRPATVGLDPRQFDPRQKVPSELGALAHGLRVATAVATGFDPKVIGQGAYNWRHPIRLYQNNQAQQRQLATNIKAAQAAGMSLNDMVKHGIVPTSAGTVVDLGGGMGKTNLLRPLGVNNTLQHRLTILDQAIGHNQNKLEEAMQGGMHPDVIKKQVAHTRDLLNLRKQMAKVDVNAIMKKQPHELTRAEFFAHPYTVFHKTESSSGLGWLTSGIHAGTMKAAYDRTSSELGSGFKPGHNLEGLWITPRNRAKVGQPHGNIGTVYETAAPGRRQIVLSDHAANESGQGYGSLWSSYFNEFPGKKPSPHYRDSPAQVNAFFNALRDPVTSPSVNRYGNKQVLEDVRPYLNDAEDPGSISYVAHDPSGMQSHQTMILKALQAGAHVPSRVLRDYPALRSAARKAQRNGGVSGTGATLKPYVRPSQALIQEGKRAVGVMPANRTQDYARIKTIIDNAFAKAEARKQQIEAYGTNTGSDFANHLEANMPQFHPDTTPGSLEYSLKNNFFDSKKSAHDAIDASYDSYLLTQAEKDQIHQLVNSHYKPKESTGIPVPPVFTEEGGHIDDLHFFQHTTKDAPPHVQVNAADTYYMGHAGADKSLTDHVKNWGGFSPSEWENLSTAMKQYWINDYVHTKLDHYGLSGKPYQH